MDMKLRAVLWIFVIVIAAVWADVASANSCFNFENRNNSACRAYTYDTIDVYFKDDSDREQSVVVKRVRDSNRNVVHADYDFIVYCPNGCTNSNAAVQDVLWSWRNAWLDNRFYTKEEVCDPSLSACCDVLGNCTQPFDVKDTLETKRGPKYPGGSVDKWLDRTDKGTRIWDTTLRNKTANGEEVKRELMESNFKEPKFIIQQTRDGVYIVCALKDANGNCEHINGRANVGYNVGFANFDHSSGAQFNLDLDRFMRDWFSRDQGMQCSQQMSGSGDQWTIVMRCHRH